MSISEAGETMPLDEKMTEWVEPDKEPPMPQLTPTDPGRLLAIAVDKGADVERLEKLMDLQERWQATQARTAYFAALARFQRDLDPIPRDRDVRNRDGTVRYRYATLDQILRHIREPMAANGLSWRWEPGVPGEDGTETTCIITHAEGHSERSTVMIPGITAGGTNAAQDAGGANTYGRRYSLINVLGIQAVDDNDAEGVKGGPIDAIMAMMVELHDPMVLRAVAAVKEGFAHGGDVEMAAEAYAVLDSDQLQRLWVAPSKGGIWTTAERNRMKTDTEFKDLVVKHRQDSVTG